MNDDMINFLKTCNSVMAKFVWVASIVFSAFLNSGSEAAFCQEVQIDRNIISDPVELDWWEHELPKVPADADGSFHRMYEWLERRRNTLKREILRAPEDLRKQTGYLLRLVYFKNGGPPIGLPYTHLHFFFGSPLTKPDIVAAIARKIKKDPDFINIKILKRILLESGTDLDRIIARTLSALNAIDDDLKQTLLELSEIEKREGDRSEHWVSVLKQLELGIADRPRLEYGISTGPVGENAVKMAMQTLSDPLPLSMDTADDRWVICINVLAKNKATEAIPLLLRYAPCLGPVEPSNEPWSEDAENKYPAISALLSFGKAVPETITAELFEPRLIHLSRVHTFIVETYAKVLAAILTPKGALEWVAQTRRETDRLSLTRKEYVLNCLEMFEEALTNLEYVPRYISSYPFVGKIYKK